MADSIEILSHTASLSYTGEKFKGDGYYNSSDGLHTTAWTLNNFLGRIWVEGSLATTPGDSDWYSIPIGGATDYKEYTAQTSETVAFSFTGNHVWVRARVDRSALDPAPGSYDQSLHGTVEKVLLNR
jgi:hypothetical protein